MKPSKGLRFSFFALLLVGVFGVSACSSLESRKVVPDDLASWDEGLSDTLNAAAVTTYYVSGAGNDGNAGTSSSQPFLTLQRASDLTNPGDIVFIMDGTYTNSDPGSTILNIARSGERGKYIRYKAFPGHSPVLQATQNWSAIKVDGAAYILIEGLTVIGNNDNVTEAQALSQIQDANGSGKFDEGDTIAPKPEYAGNGIDVSYKYENFAQPSHHVIVRNNTVRKFGGGGINGYGADFVLVEDNRVDSTSWYSPYDPSGINFYQSRDTQPGYAGYRFVIRRNVTSNNRNFVPFFGANFSQPTDGNGIIIDDNKNTQSDGKEPVNGIPQDFGPYTGKILIVNNVVYDNFGRGIHVFESSNVTILHNTTFNNSRDTKILDGEITAVNAENVRVYNNIMAPNQNRPANTIYNASDAIFDYNLVFGGTGFAGEVRNNLVGIDPQFVNAAGNNFKLQTSSPAIDKGNNYGLKEDFEKSLRPKGVGVDIGAYEIR
jgi:parallel beta-helix repeat protein